MTSLNSKRLIIFFVAITTVFVLTHIPQRHMPEELNMFGMDKVIHVVVYGIITVLALASFNWPGSFMAIAIVVCSIALFGAFDEYTQSFVGRSSSIYDWISDVIGITIAAAAIKLILWQRRLPRKRRFAFLQKADYV